jgi:hypothetical protein
MSTWRGATSAEGSATMSALYSSKAWRAWSGSMAERATLTNAGFWLSVYLSFAFGPPGRLVWVTVFAGFAFMIDSPR